VDSLESSSDGIAMQSQYRLSALAMPRQWRSRELFVECSSNAFGLASAPVSLKPSRPRPLPGARNESTAFAESLRAVECVPGRKKALAIRRRSVQQSQRQKSRNGRALNSE